MIKNNLSKLMGEKRISITQLSKISKISRTTLTSLYFDRTGGIKFDTLDKICKSLNCDVVDIFEFKEEWKMKINLKESEKISEIKIDDKKLTNVVSYSISSDVNTTKITLVLEFPKDNVNVQVDCWLALIWV